MSPSAGYSHTPLAKKLGIKDGCLIRLINPPANYFQLFSDWPSTVEVVKDKTSPKDIIHFFVSNAKQLSGQLSLLRHEIKQTGMIWVSWPKKTSKVITDVTEDIIRNKALQIGLVDVKVCAIDEIWSGLKLVIPLSLRKKH